MKTIGVLGGIGPQTTIDFETRVHRVAQRLIPPSRNAGYPPTMLVHYLRHAPFLLTEEGTPQLPLRLDPRLLEAVADLRSRRVDGVVLGCTEIPFLLPEADGEANLINPVQLLAEAAVRIASMDTEWIS